MAKHMGRSVRHSRERGFAIMFYATMLFFVIGCVGLAVDVGTIYMIKARLSAAADAAALAAGRSVNLALTIEEAQANAVTTANQFFTTNFPNGYFNTIGSPTVTPTLTQETDGNGNPNGVLDIQVTASVSAPTYFMNIFNVSRINVAATGTASRRGLVLDAGSRHIEFHEYGDNADRVPGHGYRGSEFHHALQPLRPNRAGDFRLHGAPVGRSHNQPHTSEHGHR
jgi:Flp pilus assembly protein TadG